MNRHCGIRWEQVLLKQKTKSAFIIPVVTENLPTSSAYITIRCHEDTYGLQKIFITYKFGTFFLGRSSVWLKLEYL